MMIEFGGGSASDPGLAELADLWPRLSPAFQSSVLTVARAAVGASALSVYIWADEVLAPAGRDVLQRYLDITGGEAVTITVNVRTSERCIELKLPSGADRSAIEARLREAGFRLSPRTSTAKP